jgi:uncharacterized protein (TIGR02300 family)
MAKPDMGLKRTCVSCATKFYDLMRAPAVCPKCGTEQPAEQPRPRRPSPAAEAKARRNMPAAAPVADEVEVPDAPEVEADEDEEVLEDTSDLEDGDADLAADIEVVEPNDDEES